jgi:hypothetical protein
LNKHPGLAVFHLASTFDFTAHLDTIRAGARALLPKPDKLRRPDNFVQESIYLLDTLKKCLKITPSATVAKLPRIFKQCMDEITMLRELTDITAVIDRYLASVLGRSITFVSRKSELTCDSINLNGSVQPLSINIQAVGNSPLHTVLANGSAFFGESTDPLLKEKIYLLTEPPLSNRVLVAPLKCLGRVVALTYADFGPKSHAEIDLDLVSIMTIHAGFVYENALYKKKFAKMLQTQQ